MTDEEVQDIVGAINGQEFIFQLELLMCFGQLRAAKVIDTLRSAYGTLEA